LEELLVDQPTWGTRIHWWSLIISFFAGLILWQEVRDGSARLGQTIIWSVLTLASGAYAWMRSGSYVRLQVANGDPIELYGAIPDRQTVENFIDVLTRTVRTYAIEKYGKVSLLLPAEVQIQRITWLRDRNFISHDKRDQLIEEVKQATTAKAERIVGFRQEGTVN
jgi:hypothetical protein